MLPARVLLAVWLSGGLVLADDIRGVVDLAGRPVDPLAFGQGVRAHVFIFTTSDCPISNRYAPEITRLATVFADRGIRFWLVYPVPSDTARLAREHTERFGLTLPVVRDTLFELVRLTGVTVTPEVAVIERGGRQIYRGRIDDRYVDFGRDRPAPTTRDLQNVLDAIVAGRPVTPGTTKAIGCYLPDVLK
jgi:hypothetical protein